MLLCSSVSDLSLTFLSSVGTVMKDLFPDCLFDCDWMKQNQILHLVFFSFFLSAHKHKDTWYGHFTFSCERTDTDGAAERQASVYITTS